METKLIFNRPIALELSNNGYSIINIIKNKKDISKDVYVFENTEDFRNSLDKILTKRGFSK